MVCSLLLDLSCWPNTHPIAIFVIIRYMIKGLPGIGGIIRGRFYKYFLIFSKASWQSLFHTLIFFFLSNWDIGSQVTISWDIPWLLTIKPNSFPDFNPNKHFMGFNLNWNLCSLSNNIFIIHFGVRPNFSNFSILLIQSWMQIKCQ